MKSGFAAVWRHLRCLLFWSAICYHQPFVRNNLSTVYMSMEAIATDKAPGAIGPYSQAIRAGDFLYCSGQIPIDPATGEFVSSDVAEQTEQVLRNLAEVLEAGGSNLGKVVKTTVFLRDMADFGAMNEVYARHFAETKPARATVAAAGLPKDALVEIECVALVSD